MKPPKKDRTEADILRTIADLFDQVLEDDMDEVDATLRGFGFDPDEVGARMKAVADKALAESPLNWRNRAPSELARARAKLDEYASTVNLPIAQLRELASSLMAQIEQRHGRPALAHFRNLEEVTDEDLASLVEDLRFLIDDESK